MSNQRYSDPYVYRSNGYYGTPMYYGAWDSPLNYIFLAAMLDDDNSNDPLPPESDGYVSEAVLSYAQVVTSEVDLIAAKEEDK